MNNTDIINMVRERVGRRHRISRREMMEILTALGEAGLDLRNGYVDDTVVYDSPDGRTGDPLDEQDVGRAATAWANLCRDIVVVSILTDGHVRYDEPGRMHPAQQAAVSFVSCDLRDADYIRRHAARVLLVADDPLLDLPPPIVLMRRNLATWQRERNECDDARLSSVDSLHAYRCGQALLSQLLGLRAELERANAVITPREVIARLAPIIHLARGEAQDRLRAQYGDDGMNIPGIISHAPSSGQ